MNWLEKWFQKISGITKKRDELHKRKNKVAHAMQKIQESSRIITIENEKIVSVTNALAKATGSVK